MYLNFPMRVDKDKRHLPDKAYPNEIAFFFSSWVCKDRDGSWHVFTEKPILKEVEGIWTISGTADVLDVSSDKIIDPKVEWNKGLWRG